MFMMKEIMFTCPDWLPVLHMFTVVGGWLKCYFLCRFTEVHRAQRWKCG